MCGIAGIFFLQPNRSINVSHLQKMTSIIRHRGPDDEGYVLFNKRDYTPNIYGGIDTPQEVFTSDTPFTPIERISDTNDLKSLKVALAHRRLSIIDLSPRGHQPMCYDNQRYWIIYNGEIYNWKELRNHLEKLGQTFVSQSDTEVILASYAQWGKDCLNRFNGMWAFVIFDRKTETLFAARDRLGVKPLYYWFSPEGFVAFASEIKQFTVLPGWNATINEPRAYDFLVSSKLDHTSETLFNGIFQLRGGQAFELPVSDIHNSLPIYQWYSLKNTPFKGTFDEASHNVRSLLEDSIRLRLHADVPVGSCLSGGLDSSSIVCLVNSIIKNENSSINQKTFTSCSEIKKFDEREYVDEVIKNRAIEAYYTFPSVKVLCQNLDDIIWHQDEPFGSLSIYAQWQVFQLASKNNVKVMLDGQGADELLCGYRVFFSARQADLLKNFKWGTLLDEIIIVKKIHGIPIATSLFKMISYLFPNKLFNSINNIKKNRWSHHHFQKLKKIKTGNRTDFYNKSSEINFVQNISYTQLFYTNLPGLLHWEDRNSMAHSIESRVPFLDYRFLELVYSLPAEYKICRETTKLVLRKSMQNILPEKIRTRTDKMGFVTAEEYWVTKEHPVLFRQMFEESLEFLHDINKKDALILFDNVIKGKSSYSFIIWNIICLGRWVKLFKVDKII